MKRFLLTMTILMVVFGNMVAQDRSIRFEEGSYQEALNKAKKENKLLFVDCYTSWCGPCKMLANEVFTNNEVADYFNANFVSLKVDCEKGEGPALREQFGVSSYPTLLFINGDGKIVNKILGASKQPHFLTKVKEGLNSENSLSAKEKKYEAGHRDRAFVLDLIKSYKGQREARKAAQVSLELLSGLNEKELLTKEMWEVIRDYYVSGYGSEWWNFILDHSDEYADFENYRSLVDRYQPRQKETLYCFIELGKSACCDDFNGYFKTVLKVIPKMDRSEHYRFFVNALDNLVKNASPKQKKQLLVLLKESQQQQTDYFKPLYQKFFDKVEKA